MHIGLVKIIVWILVMWRIVYAYCCIEVSICILVVLRLL